MPKADTMEIPSLPGYTKFYSTGLLIVFSILLTSLAFSYRPANSISIILLVAMVLLSAQRKTYFRNAFTNTYFLSCLLFLLIQVAGFLFTGDRDQHLREISIKAGMVAIPFFFCAHALRVKTKVQLIMLVFSSALFLATAYCIFQALMLYRAEQHTTVFFYHTLLRPLHEHAVYYSFYLLFCIIYWIEEGLGKCKSPVQKTFIALLLVYFFGIIVLLSSKMALVMLLLYFFYFLVVTLIKRKNTKTAIGILTGLVLLITLIITTRNPVKNRFLDLTTGTSTLFQQEKFSSDIYFNGLQFRLLTWRFTYEILSEQKAWLTGVSAGDGQRFLNQKYVAANMYLGEEKTKQGYMIYDCHNIFLQSTLESGVPGLAVLLCVIISLLIKLVKDKKRTALLFFLCMLAFGFTESYLSRQFGIILFCFMPLFALSAKTQEELNR